MRLQVLIDHAGTFKDAVLFGGPDRLVAPAAAAVRTWRVEPKRLNGAPVVEPVTLLVRFRCTQINSQLPTPNSQRESFKATR